MWTKELDIGRARLLLLGSVRGLVSEAAEVTAAFEAFGPEAVALPVGNRELEEIETALKDKGESLAAGKAPGPTGLKDELRERDDSGSDFEDFGLFVSSTDMVFLRKLSRFGNVEMPPPSFQAALHLARAKGIVVAGVDLDDEGYTDVFLANVSLFSLMRQGRRMSRMAKRKFQAPNAEAFAFEWDRLETKVSGYARVQKAREQKVAAGIASMAKFHTRVLAVVEIERMRGIEETLRTIQAAPGYMASMAAPSPGELPSQS